MWQYLLIALGVSVLINGTLFLVAYRRKTDKLTDISYALSFIALAFYALIQGPLTAYRFVLFSMIAIWAVRLGSFLLFRVWQTGKDSRFDDMRNSFWKFGKFWMSQALAVWLILIPSLLALRSDKGSLQLAAIAGLLVWFIGLIIEATADIQKYTFSTVAANKNKWIDLGIWKYSRHPNYFGEILVWIGVYIYTLSALAVPEIWIGLASPLFIAILLIFVSGIPVLEKSADAKWGKIPAYKAYKNRTSVLVLWPPKSNS